MRIAFDYQAFVMQSYGGISRYFTKLSQGMLDMGQSVGIFAPLYRNNYIERLPAQVVHGRYIERYPARTARFFSTYNRLVSTFQLARWRPDLVHETYYSKTVSAPASCPLVITVYDMIHELYPSSFSLKDETASSKRIAVERADHVICISENTKMDLMRFYGTSASKLSVVHLGFDQFSLETNVARFVTPSGKPYLLYVGQRGGYKNFLGFLKAVASSSRLLSDFDIVSFGGGSFTLSELSQISLLGFAEKQVISMSGNDHILGNLYSSARSFVYPSFYEGFGIPPLEAMAQHCPVICSYTSSMPEVAGPAAEYFNPADTDDMRQAIERVVYSDCRVKFLCQSGAERLTRFSWAKCSRDTLNIYRRLV